MKNAAPARNEIFEVVNTSVCAREEGKNRVGGGGAEVTARLANEGSTLSVTTCECTITSYKGRMKCQN